MGNYRNTDTIPIILLLDVLRVMVWAVCRINSVSKYIRRMYIAVYKKITIDREA